MKSTTEVIEQVKKLLALSKSNNAHEASLAAATANKLIDKYRLSQMDIEISLEEDLLSEDTEPLYTQGELLHGNKSLLMF